MLNVTNAVCYYGSRPRGNGALHGFGDGGTLCEGDMSQMHDICTCGRWARTDVLFRAPYFGLVTRRDRFRDMNLVPKMRCEP